MRRLAVVAGCTGVVGYRIARYLTESGGWSVLGLSRKAPPAGFKFRHISVDLTDAKDCEQKLSAVRGVTHIFYAARYDDYGKVSDTIETAINLEMLENLLRGIEKGAKGLRHIHLVHGTKYYGGPYGRYKTPAKECDPRCMIDNFYYAQQDLIVERQKGKTWSWSISRPQAVSDSLPHVARSIPWGIAVYACLCKAKGLPLAFPGPPAAYSALFQCTDSEHLAKAVVWISMQRKCSNQAFNVANGDYFRWENLWPRIADYFEMPLGPIRPMRLDKTMMEQASTWGSIQKKYGLRQSDYATLVVWPHIDFALSREYDRMSDLTKLHKFGFHEIVDTEEMFFSFFDQYRKRKMIPFGPKRGRYKAAL